MELTLSEQELEMLIQAEGWFIKGAEHEPIVPVPDMIDVPGHKGLLDKLKGLKTALDK